MNEPKQKFSASLAKDAVYQTKVYQGLTGTLTCISTGDCQSQAAVNIGVFLLPDLPIEGGNPDAKPIFSEQLTLTDALGT